MWSCQNLALAGATTDLLTWARASENLGLYILVTGRYICNAFKGGLPPPPASLIPSITTLNHLHKKFFPLSLFIYSCNWARDDDGPTDLYASDPAIVITDIALGQVGGHSCMDSPASRTVRMPSNLLSYWKYHLCLGGTQILPSNVTSRPGRVVGGSGIYSSQKYPKLGEQFRISFGGSTEINKLINITAHIYAIKMTENFMKYWIHIRGPSGTI